MSLSVKDENLSAMEEIGGSPLLCAQGMKNGQLFDRNLKRWG
jgi:hypothetical protein